MMRNAANKMTKSIDPYTENHFCHLLKYLSEMDLSVILTPALFDYHWLRRALHGTLHPNLELICDFRPSKLSHYPSRPVPLPGVFVTTRPNPVPKSKTTTRQSLLLRHQCLEMFSIENSNVLILNLPKPMASGGNL